MDGEARQHIGQRALERGRCDERRDVDVQGLVAQDKGNNDDDKGENEPGKEIELKRDPRVILCRPELE
jgi:hypothetical protein